MGIDNIYSRSFPGANLFEISLVKDNDPELPFYKNAYFCFLSLTPGVQGQNGRGFNKDARITMKTEVEKVMALAQSIRIWARGQGQAFGNFGIWADSSKSQHGGGGKKACFVSDFIPKSGDASKRQISISFKMNDNQPIGAFFSPSEAMAVADIMDFIANKALEMEFENRTLQVGKTPPRAANGGGGGYNRQAPPQGNTGAVPPQGGEAASAAAGQALGDAMGGGADPFSGDDNPF